MAGIGSCCLTWAQTLLVQPLLINIASQIQASKSNHSCQTAHRQTERLARKTVSMELFVQHLVESNGLWELNTDSYTRRAVEACCLQKFPAARARRCRLSCSQALFSRSPETAHRISLQTVSTSKAVETTRSAGQLLSKYVCSNSSMGSAHIWCALLEDAGLNECGGVVCCPPEGEYEANLQKAASANAITPGAMTYRC